MYLFLYFYTISKSGTSNSGKEKQFYTITSIKLTLVFVSLVGFLLSSVLLLENTKCSITGQDCTQVLKLQMINSVALPTSCFSKVSGHSHNKQN